MKSFKNFALIKSSIASCFEISGFLLKLKNGFELDPSIFLIVSSGTIILAKFGKLGFTSPT